MISEERYQEIKKLALKDERKKLSKISSSDWVDYLSRRMWEFCEEKDNNSLKNQINRIINNTQE